MREFARRPRPHIREQYPILYYRLLALEAREIFTAPYRRHYHNFED